MNLPPHLCSHEKRVKLFLSWMPDWIHQDEFDHLASAHPKAAYFVDDEAVMLHPSNPDVDLLQHMIRAGLVAYRREPDCMWYRAASDASKSPSPLPSKDTTVRPQSA